jgi:hypothetical protein
MYLVFYTECFLALGTVSDSGSDRTPHQCFQLALPENWLYVVPLLAAVEKYSNY